MAMGVNDSGHQRTFHQEASVYGSKSEYHIRHTSHPAAQETTLILASVSIRIHNYIIKSEFG
ncbi:hypothetical protein T4B_5921 [Trichinella pseudospiralis]|uniref:Uncharacterized protein n=1 Tax=Trichinella pseudospiralis TaxID=6337 RepID=A0A0V1I5X4_TRIPS|nr:hypothetical protein T4B_5921 [Trichinella pseudospiralis]KRZ42803.1 hypothetical protein T4C_10651 [Trichinella pseudospiralis]